MADPIPTTPPPKKGRGCFFYGCLTCVVLFLIVCLSGFLVFRFFKNQYIAYTGSAPTQLPNVEMTDAEFQKLEDRVKVFSDAVNSGNPEVPLVLSERDINALIVKRPESQALAGKVYVSLEGDQVKGQISYPLTSLDFLSKGRYFNGEASFKVSLENGKLDIKPGDIQVKGKPAPDWFTAGFRQENLAKELVNNPKHAEAINKLESIQIRDGQVIIKAKAAPTVPPTQP